jgi:hypothetical protein
VKGLGRGGREERKGKGVPVTDGDTELGFKFLAVWLSFFESCRINKFNPIHCDHLLLFSFFLLTTGD